jgi:Holliday junction resolvasome RuvABC endonuclease subunit
MHRVLGIDPGTFCGFALLDDGERVASGTWDLSVKRHESAGMRFVRLERQLREILENGIDLIAFEEVARHAGTQAAHIYGGIVAVIKLTAEKKGIAYIGVPVGTVKKKATGKGNSDKLQMRLSATAQWDLALEDVDDNEADALWVAMTAWGQTKENGNGFQAASKESIVNADNRITEGG